MNLIELVERRAEEVPDRPGLLSEDGRVWTYAEVIDEAARAAGALRALGAGPGDRVALYLRNGPDLVWALLGAWKLGAVAVTISALYQQEELAHALEETSPEVLVADARRLDVLESTRSLPVRTAVSGGEVAGAWVAFDRLRAETDPEPATFVPGPDDESAILFTGGTTGRPKPVRTTHVGWAETLETLARASRGRPGPYPPASPDAPPNLVALPLFHSGGQQAFLFAYLVGRVPLLMERFVAQRLGELVERHRLDNLFLLPTMLYDLVHAPGELKLTSVRSVLVSGQELSLALRKRFEERFRVPILQNYGSTEVGHVAGWTGPDLRAGLWKPGSAGRVYDGVELEIRDEQGRPVPLGEVGEICVKSAVAKGYLGGGDELIVKDGWVQTQDMGYVDEDRVLFVVGRRRDLIKCGGFQVWPAELEEVLLQHPLVKEVSVVGAPDERLGEVPIAFVVPVSRVEGLDEDRSTSELIEHCRSHLAHFKAIRGATFVDALPRSHTGKIDRARLLSLRDGAVAAVPTAQEA